MLYSGDAQWWRHYWREVEITEGEHWTVSSAMRGQEDVGWIRGVPPEDGALGMSRSPSCIHTGGNSGFSAINLVALWGVARIILLGFDMQATGGKRHAHADHPDTLGNPQVPSFPVWRERFAAAAEDLRAMGVEVINASRETALQTFERRDLAQLLPRPAIVLDGMKGFGDNLYQRPFVRELARGHIVILRTPWPQLYGDLAGVTVARTETDLRTQRKNEDRFRPLYAAGERALHKLSRARPDLAARRISYIKDLGPLEGSVWVGMTRSVGCAPMTGMDLPPLPESPVVTDRPICVVRPVTVRSEWMNEARNPLPEHVADVARWLRAEGMYVVSVADLQDGEEVALDPLPEADLRFHAGELEPLQLLALVGGAAAVVGGVGWIVPAAIAAHVPAFVVLGGQGGHNAPDRITDASMAVDLIGWGVPDEFCRCSSMRHACSKRNTRLRAQFDEWRLRTGGTRPLDVAA